NRRKAASERTILIERANAAKNCPSVDQNALDKLIEAATEALPTINMPVAVCDDILRSSKYRTYERRVDNYERAPASEGNHANRISVGTKLFPRNESNIVYAALSSKGGGVANYGPVAVEWRVQKNYLEPRISLLEENSFSFFARHGLGALGA